MAIITGGPTGETLDGGADNDVIDGAGGNDVLNGFGGDDLLEGGAGDDTLNGGDGFDTGDYRNATQAFIFSLGGAATALSEDGAEVDELTSVEAIFGTAFDDVFAALAGFAPATVGGFARFRGGAGDDIVSGSATAAAQSDYGDALGAIDADLTRGTVIGGVEIGTDTLIDVVSILGSAFADLIAGGATADSLFGAGGDDQLFGRDGDDRLAGGAGADALDGGEGTDIAVYDDDAGPISANLQTGVATDSSSSIDTFTSIEGVEGSAFDDSLIGGGGGDRFFGGDGDDRIIGRSGDDIIQGDDGADELFGNSGADELEGGDGDDLLSGGGGADVMDGGLGADTYVVDDAGDVIVDAGGVDTVLATLAFNLAGGLENLELLDGAGDADASGNSAANRITGSSGANTLRGGGGDDVLDGGGGDDILLGQVADDTLSGGAGRDFLRGNEGDDTLSGGDDVDVLNGEDGIDVVSGGAGRDKIIGGVGDDTLMGDGDNDRIFGNSGADRIVGGAGNDVLTGQFAADTFVFGLGSGIDTVTDFAAGEDKIDLTAYGFADFAALDAVLADVNGRAQINMNGNTDVLRLNGVLEADLSESDFLL